MALYHLFCLINIHKTTSNADIISWLLLPVDISRIQKVFSRFWFSLKSQLEPKEWEEKSKNQHDFHDKRDDGNINREEVEMVMSKLGLFCGAESDEKLQDSMGLDEFSQMFDEKEPSLEEVKEAFNVFDENKDGYIDAEELQRVIQILGLKEGDELDNCRKMISPFDYNKDGRIDFNEFVKFMETLS